MTDDVRKERQAKNEVLFRALNERIEAVAKELAFDGLIEGDDREYYLCECADDECSDQVPLSRDEYERVRASAIQFVVVPGHVVADIETVIVSSDRFDIVEKDLGERLVAESTDPRASFRRDPGDRFPPNGR